jgi:hypothetical protein
MQCEAVTSGVASAVCGGDDSRGSALRRSVLRRRARRASAVRGCAWDRLPQSPGGQHVDEG